ncbi:transposase [Nocardioides massiliensis]|uniref:Transposase IS204/IS1001/IS1096/IS1165 DDE domain-containing protein n=1 Tax=Nocardioides massiliensis TaxID=1325935 RepID=A0ABT9NK78_9ACTN|nr:transposase [Nocardioides massiliensis]MDP9820824.1 hypothetical protein [Nocardioides massiliensis]
MRDVDVSKLEIRVGTFRQDGFVQRDQVAKGSGVHSPTCRIHSWILDSHRLEQVLRVDDPTDEIGAAWAVKERLRLLLACTDLDAADHARGMLGLAVLGADMDETWRLWETVSAWWDEIETFIVIRVTNARTEAANTSIKQIKRTGRGYRNPAHYQSRILLRSARRTRRRRTLIQQATTFNCG